MNIYLAIGFLTGFILACSMFSEISFDRTGVIPETVKGFIFGVIAFAVFIVVIKLIVGSEE